jgi:cobalt-zinc-cadmium efflux system outer membrane protein
VGQSSPGFEKAIGDLEKTLSLPAYEQLAERVRDNPDLARWSSEIERRRAGVDAERAKLVPDVTVTAGVTRFSQFDDHAYIVGISVPLPLFNRNRGGILEASHRLDKASDELRAAEGRVLTELSRAYQRLAAIDKEIGTLRTILLPGAQSAFDASTRGYQLGKFSFLDVLDAQRTLFQTRTQYLRALADYQRGVSEIERLVGGPVDVAANHYAADEQGVPDEEQKHFEVTAGIVAVGVVLGLLILLGVKPVGSAADGHGRDEAKAWAHRRARKAAMP